MQRPVRIRTRETFDEGGSPWSRASGKSSTAATAAAKSVVGEARPPEVTKYGTTKESELAELTAWVAESRASGTTSTAATAAVAKSDEEAKHARLWVHPWSKVHGHLPIQRFSPPSLDMRLPESRK